MQIKCQEVKTRAFVKNVTENVFMYDILSQKSQS